METSFQFTLPRGLIDSAGGRHRTGIMRLATARDELETLRDPRVAGNEPYLSVLLLSRVVTRIGEIEGPAPEVIESLFASDFAFLEDLYERLNASEPVLMGVSCPSCSSIFQVQAAPLEG